MEMITINDANIKKHFKVIMQEPEWVRGYKEAIYLKSNSLKSWHAYMNSDLKHTGYASSQKIENTSRDKCWSGSKTYSDYLDILDNGDDTVMKKIKIETKEAINDLYKKHEKIIQGYKFDVVGEQFDIGLVLSGVPEVWLEPVEEEEEIIKVSMKIDLTFNSGVKSHEVIKNASRLIGIAKVLEDMGVQVKIEGYNFPTHYDAKHRDRILIIENLIKDYNEPINYRKLSSYITTAQFRRGGFILIEQLAERVAGGYGTQKHISGVIRIDKDSAVSQFENKVFGEV